MEFIQTIMPLLPDTWDKSFKYEKERYALVNLDYDSDEYQDVLAKLRSLYPLLVVYKIERVQHPFAYALYNLHKENLETTSKKYTELECVYKASSECVTEYLDFNDERRRQKVSASNSYVYINRSKITTDSEICDRDSNTYPKYILWVNKYCIVE